MWLWGQLLEQGQHTRSHTLKGNILALSQKSPTINSSQLLNFVSSATQDGLLTDLILYRYYIQLLWSHQFSHPVMPRRYCFALFLLPPGSYHLPSSSSMMVPGIYFVNKISNILFLVISKSLYDNSNVQCWHYVLILFWCVPCLFIV